jgi:hypothetical protein
MALFSEQIFLKPIQDTGGKWPDREFFFDLSVSIS